MYNSATGLDWAYYSLQNPKFAYFKCRSSHANILILATSLKCILDQEMLSCSQCMSIHDFRDLSFRICFHEKCSVIYERYYEHVQDEASDVR